MKTFSGAINVLVLLVKFGDDYYFLSKVRDERTDRQIDGRRVIAIALLVSPVELIN